ncbi:MAG: phospholipid carrier-dependent glycosyltransferase, partial [Alphaproteobacteria bacterium]
MQKRQLIYASVALSVLIFLYYSIMLGDRSFATPDEARYVEISREMLVTGDFVTPRLNGVKYFEKPPLFYWLQAGVMKVFGSSEFAMRMVTVAIAVGGVVATFAFAASIYGLLVGAVAALILATSPLYFGLAHLIILDMSASVFVTLSLFSFYKAITSTSTHRRRLWFWGFAVACGLGVMTKGVMALALPGPVIVAWLTATKQWGRLRPFYPFSSLIIFFSIVIPWHAAVSLANPEFAYKYFIVEHFLRFTTNHHEHYQPIWYFVPVVLLGLFPWIAAAFVRYRNDQPSIRHCEALLGAAAIQETKTSAVAPGLLRCARNDDRGLVIPDKSTVYSYGDTRNDGDGWRDPLTLYLLLWAGWV